MIILKNVNLDAFNYIMQIVNKPCDLYNKGKEFNEKSLMNKYKRPLHCVVLILQTMI